MAQRAVDHVRIRSSTLINETDCVAHALVRVQVSVRCSALTDDHSAGFDAATTNSHQCVGVSFRHGSEEGRRNEWPSSKPPLLCGMTAETRSAQYVFEILQGILNIR